MGKHKDKPKDKHKDKPKDKHKDEQRDDETRKATRENALPKRKSLCHLERHLKEQLVDFKELVREPTHVCRKCGRAANSPKRLCRAEPL